MADVTQIDAPLGSQVRVEIIKTPASEAAIKTLRRILAKDPQIAKDKKRDKLSRFRSMRVKVRGGRPWEHRPAMRQPVQGCIGEAGTIRLTPDVLPDLASVGRFIKVTPSV